VTSYLDELFSLAGRVVVVTGGSSGIGRAMATALGRAGAQVVLVARRPEPLAETVAELREYGVEAASVGVDLADRKALVWAAEKMALAFGEPDILVTAAAVNHRPPLDELTLENWDDTLALNVTAPFLLGQRFGPGMAARGWGRVIHVASQQAVRAYLNSGAYGVSKAGVTALARSQAEAWSAAGVCCNAVAPGVVRTPLTAPVFADEATAATMAARTLMGRNGEPADYAGVALFLASDAAAYITGQTLFVDGGFSAH
jgi:NAD(P)-dependent dehydrogenase (short-subunit alcohol dehydrogenase family)